MQYNFREAIHIWVIFWLSNVILIYTISVSLLKNEEIRNHNTTHRDKA